MHKALLPPARQVCQAHLQSDDSRPAQLAGHLLLHFWIGASAACEWDPLTCILPLGRSAAGSSWRKTQKAA